MRLDHTVIDPLLDGQTAPRRDLFLSVRSAVLDSLDQGFEEVLQGKMIGYVVPKARYPKGYHADPKQPLPLASLAAQKSHVALYLFGLYADPTLKAWFRDAWLATGTKLDLGASCLRMRTSADVSLDTIRALFAGWKVDAYVEQYERGLASAKPR